MDWFRKLRSPRSVPTWGVLLLLAPALIWAVYPVRELVAAELIFSGIVLSVALLGVLLYFLGAVVELAADTAGARMRITSRGAEKDSRKLGEIGRP